MGIVTGAQAPRTDAFVSKARELVPVTALTTVIVAPTSTRSYDSVVVYLKNLGADELNAVVEVSPDGTFPGATLPDDAFAAMAVGEMRYIRIPSDVQFFRVTGAFAALAGDVEVSVISQRNAR